MTLIKGDNKAYSKITGLTTFTGQDFLDRIDAALATAGITDFSDSDFRISDNGDSSKKVAFEVSGLSAATVRTITMPDANVNLADVNNSILTDGSRAMAAALDMGTNKLLNVAAGTAATDGVNYGQLTALDDLIKKLEFQDSVIDKDLTAPPGSPSTGDRYLIGLDTGASAATGAWATHDGKITEWNGSAWVFTTPTTGMFVVADDETTVMYRFGGTTWTAQNFESSTASTGLVKVGFDIRLADANANGLNVTSGVYSVNVDDSSIERGVAAGNPLQIKDLGVTTAKINNDAVTTGKVANLAITTAKLALDSVDKTIINADVGGAGLNQQADGSFDVNELFVEATNANAGAITAGSVVRLSASGSFDLAQADTLANAEGAVGVLLATTSSAATGKIQVAGKIAVNRVTETIAGTSNLTPGKDVFLSKVTAGSVTDADTGAEALATGNARAMIGRAISATEIVIMQGEITELL